MYTNQIFLSIILITGEMIMVRCVQDFSMDANQFPDIFYMDDYYKCQKDEYCTANIHLVSENNEYKIWKDIEKWSLPRSHFNRTIIHRTLCIPNKYKNYAEKRNFVESKTNEELKKFNLSAQMFSMVCKQKFETNIDAILIAISSFTVFVIISTICDQISLFRNEHPTVHKWLTCFSLTSNLKKLTSDKNPDFQRLKCIQGIRTYQSILIILTHSFIVTCQLHIKNPLYVEELFSSRPFQISRPFTAIFMQTYFLISTWLLTNQVLEMHKKNRKFSIRDGFILFLHRITRFWLPLITMIFVLIPVSLVIMNGPGTFETAFIFEHTCKENWWATLFYVTNILDINQVCNLVMWSMTVDTQVYLICIVFLHVTLTYKLDFKRSLALMFILTYTISAFLFYKKGLPVLAQLDLKNIKRIDFYNDKILEANYFGIWMNAGSSLVGVLFGYVYFHRKHTKVEAFENIFGIFFGIIPVAAILMCSLDTGRIGSVLVGPLIKPLYAFGIASGIYGISRNIIQGWAKRICANRFATFLGNFTFSVYICHVIIVLTKEANNSSLIEVSLWRMIVSSISNIIQSFALGTIFALTIEQPGINIKNLLLPEIRKRDEFCKEK